MQQYDFEAVEVGGNMKNSWIGVLLALQFFTVLPIKRQLEMTRQTMTAMYGAMVVIGILFGAVLSGVYTLLHAANVSTLFLAVILVVVHIICTGGLHLDGYVDVSDAFFSYGDKEKRLTILDDPRTGAFGVISVVVLILLHTAALYELLEQQYEWTWVLLLAIPIILRIGVLLYFTTMQCAKTSGIAYYFASNISIRTVRYLAIGAWVLLLFVTLYFALWPVVAALVMQLIIVFSYRRWSVKHFGGMNGDLTGALYEGSNVLLWLTVLLFI